MTAAVSLEEGGVRAIDLRWCPALPQACRVELGEDEARDDSSTVVVVLV